MFENLSEKLDKAFSVLKGHGKITEINVAETLKEVRRALLDADVSFKIAKEFTKKVKDKAIGQDVLTTLNPGQLMVKLVKDELTELMGSQAEGINLEEKTSVILIAGLQGSGKTTFTGKLALFLKKKKSKKPLLVACDVYRPAAVNQLEILAEQVGVKVFTNRESQDPVAIAKAAVEYAKQNGHNVVIVDTAGRLAIGEQMMNEIAAVKSAINPQETLFVVDSMTGQDAVNTAKAFNDKLNYNGVVLTKLDGDTRGGAALTIKSVVEKPIKFVGTGEKMDALDVFPPNRMADRILGMGDVVSLVEKAQEQFDAEFEGIGIEFNIMDGYITVISPIPETPSSEAGLQSGDKIVRINDESAYKITQKDVFEKLRGPKGSQVEVTIRRSGEDDFVVTLTRAKIPIHSVLASFMINRDIGYIKVNRFARTTAEEISSSLYELEQQKQEK